MTVKASSPFSAIVCSVYMMILAGLLHGTKIAESQISVDLNSTVDRSLIVGRPNSCTIADLGYSMAQSYFKDHGATATCPTPYFAYGACNSGEDRDCAGYSHKLFCTAYDRDFVKGSETEWLGSIARGGSAMSWSTCPGNMVVTSRCGAGQNPDCNLNNGRYHHGIRCRELGTGYYLQYNLDPSWVCKSYGVDGFCGFGYAPVASCGSGENSDCDWDGCSGIDAFLGLKCLPWGYLKSLDWDTSRPPVYQIDILNDVNPIVGTFAELKADFEAQASAQASASLDFTTEFNGNLGVESSLLSLFGFPSIGGLFGGDNFVELNVDGKLMGGASFQAAAQAQASASLNAYLFTYTANPLDSWSENFVRFVYYRRRQIKEVIGTVSCCNCVKSSTEVRARYEVSQTGMLALHIKNYPGLNLDTITGEEVVNLYLNGTIVGYRSGSFARAFTDTQSFVRRFTLIFKRLFRFS